MNKKLFLTLAAGIFTLLSSCSDSKVEVGDSSVKSTAKVTIVVTDAINGEPVTGAKLTLLSAGKTAKEDKNGTYIFNNVNVGSHEVLVEKTGEYAAMIIRNVGVESDTDDEGVYVNVYIAKDAAGKFDLYPLTAGLEGYLTYTNKDGKTLPAKGATVKVVFNTDYFTDFVQKIWPDENGVKVGDDGKYTFENLPARNLSYNILVDKYTTEDGITFQASTIIGSGNLALGALASNGTKPIDPTANVEVFAVSNYTNIIENDLTKAVKFTFTAPVDPKKLDKESVLFCELDSDDDIVENINEYADIKWNSDYTELTLTPDKWTGAKFNVCFNLVSATGKFFVTEEDDGDLKNAFPVTLITKVDISGKKVDSFATTGKISCTTPTTDITENSASACVTWKKVEGAEKYEFSCRDEYDYGSRKKEQFYNCGTYTIPTSGDAEKTEINFSPLKADGKVYVRVRAVNATYQTYVSTALTIEAK